MARDLHSIAAHSRGGPKVGPKRGEEATPARAKPERRGGETGEGRGPQGSAVPRGIPLNAVLQSTVKGGQSTLLVLLPLPSSMLQVSSSLPPLLSHLVPP